MCIYLLSKSLPLLSSWICLFAESKLKTDTSRECKQKPKAANLSRSCGVLLDVFVWQTLCGSDTRAERKKKSPRRGSCQCPFHCSAFVCLQVNVVTKLGVELDLQVTQHLLYRWHSLLKASDLLLQRFLIAEHGNSNYMTTTTISTHVAGHFLKQALIQCSY